MIEVGGGDVDDVTAPKLELDEDGANGVVDNADAKAQLAHFEANRCRSRHANAADCYHFGDTIRPQF